MNVFLFFFHINSIYFSKSIHRITDIPHNDNVSYLVFAHRAEKCPHCQNLGPTWNLASEMGEGFAVYSELNCLENESLCRDVYRISAVPTIFYLFNKEITIYQGYRNPKHIVNWVSQFTNDTSILIDDSNYSEQIKNKQKIAILFTKEKKNIPKIWAAVEKVVNSRNNSICFFVSRDENLHQKLNLGTFPGIYVRPKDGEDFIEYKGKRIVSRVAQFIENPVRNNEL